MSLLFDLSIGTSAFSQDLQEILDLRYEIEDSIENQEIGEVVDVGIMMDGSSIDIAFIADDEDPARVAIEELLEAKDLLENATIDVSPYDSDDEYEEEFEED